MIVRMLYNLVFLTFRLSTISGRFKSLQVPIWRVGSCICDLLPKGGSKGPALVRLRVIRKKNNNNNLLPIICLHIKEKIYYVALWVRETIERMAAPVVRFPMFSWQLSTVVKMRLISPKCIYYSIASHNPTILLPLWILQVLRSGVDASSMLFHLCFNS